MFVKFTKRMLTEPDKKALLKFSWNFGFKGMQAVNRFKKRLKKGSFFPAFLFISVTDRCNLSCQGCWVTQTEPPREMDISTINNIITECKKQGSYFFGILGGEPMLRKDLFEIFRKHPDAYFLLFTNGTLITDESAQEMRKLGNVSPLISIEGNEEVSDVRRGGKNVYSTAMKALDICARHRLVTGAAASICKSNIDDIASREFLELMIKKKVHYFWYYIYRPVGPDPCPELALNPDQITQLRQFIVDARLDTPMLIVDAYWDHDGKALCPAAVGMGHHIGPAGDIEPCPPLQFSADNVGDGSKLAEVFANSFFLEEFRKLACRTTQGCIIMEKPYVLNEFLLNAGALDTSGRGTGHNELSAMTPMMSQVMPNSEIPEKSRLYRFAKKNWFFGFGAYG